MSVQQNILFGPLISQTFVLQLVYAITT